MNETVSLEVAIEVVLRNGPTFETIAGLCKMAVEAEREKVAAWMIDRSYATGHGDTTEDLLEELDWQITESWSKVVMASVESEREACAKVCEQEVCACCWEDDAQAAAEHLAERIRARGQA